MLDVHAHTEMTDLCLTTGAPDIADAEVGVRLQTSVRVRLKRVLPMSFV